MFLTSEALSFCTASVEKQGRPGAVHAHTIADASTWHDDNWDCTPPAGSSVPAQPDWLAA